MNRPLTGKTALITGASRGIGRAVALQLAKLGANIVINYARNEEAAKEAKALVEKEGVKAILFPANVGDPTALDPLIKTAVEHFGGFDILVHCAALGAFKPTHMLKVNQWDLSLDVNTKALYLLAQKQHSKC